MDRLRHFQLNLYVAKIGWCKQAFQVCERRPSINDASLPVRGQLIAEPLAVRPSHDHFAFNFGHWRHLAIKQLDRVLWWGRSRRLGL